MSKEIYFSKIILMIGGFAWFGLLGGCQVTSQRSQQWLEHYRGGWAAIEEQDFLEAETRLRRALAAAQTFKDLDRRYAETLDDLGLVYVKLGNFQMAEKMQGRAVGELMLSAGPWDRRIGLFIDRLGSIYQQLGKQDAIEALKEKPYLIFEKDYILPNARLAKRLDGLMADYRIAQNQTAANTVWQYIRQIKKQQKKVTKKE